jgi:hypothetical protein
MFLVGFGWVSPKVFRLTRLHVAALWAWMNKGVATRSLGSSPQLPPMSKPGVADALHVIAYNASPLPEAHARNAAHSVGQGVSPVGIRCAATKSIKGLRNSIGYLVIANEDLVLITRRLFKYRVHQIRIKDINQATWKRGLLMHRLIMNTSDGEISFYVFKDIDVSRIGQEMGRATTP